MPDRGAMLGCAATLLLGVALMGIGCQHQQPGPVTPSTPPAPFVCGPDASSVPDFEVVSNDLASAAGESDDADALAAIDVVAKRVGRPVAVCAVGIMLPDFRNAPVTGAHLEMWQAREQVGQ